MGEGARGFFVSGPYPFPQAPIPNSLKGLKKGRESRALGPVFPGQLMRGLGGGLGGGGGTPYKKFPPASPKTSLREPVRYKGHRGLRRPQATQRQAIR